MAARLVARWAVNVLALWLANEAFTSVRIHGWTAYLVGAAALGIGNAAVKPVLTLLTLPLVVVTLGAFLLVINVAVVALAEWIAPNLSIDGFWTYVGVVVIVWAVNWGAGHVLHDVERRGRRPS